jgi:hypothetical protein
MVELAHVLAAVLFLPAIVNAETPALPQTFLDTTPVAPAGASIVVPAGGNFQAALNAALPGDQILLEAGATFTGPFTLPVKSGSDWITIRTSAPDSGLPPYGVRITPSWSPSLPKIVSAGSQPALRTAAGAHHYRFVGIEFTVANNVTTNYGIVTIGDGSAAQNSLSTVPYAITFDRVFVHGNATGNITRGLALNSASTAVVNSYVSDIHAVGYDTQAIAVWNGPGPFKVANNYLEAAGENVMFGGADPVIPNLVPSDIEFRGNYLFKPVTWRQGSPTYAGYPWSIKNIFELKNAQRVLVDGNVMEQNWPQAQNGYSVLFTVRNQGGTAPWCIVADVTFTHNIVRHVANGVNVLGKDDTHPSEQANRILIQDNLFDDVNAAVWGGSGRLFQFVNAAANVTVDHNTSLQSGDFIVASGQAQVGFTFSNNITPNGTYGLGGDNCYGQPLSCLAIFFPGAVITRDVIVGGVASRYPAGNFFPATLAAVMFVGNGSYALDPASPYKNAGTDGRDLGVDWGALIKATANSITGTDVTPPSISIAQPIAGATVSGVTSLVATASDDQTGVSQVGLLVDGVSVATLGTPPYQSTWNTTALANGPHAISAVATDGAGNQAAAAVDVTVANIVISGVTVTGVDASTATIGWSTNLPADSLVQYGPTVAYGSSDFDPTLVTSHTRTISGLASSTTYHYRALSRDAGGNLASSGDSTFTTPEVIKVLAVTPVSWMSAVNVTVNGGSMTKTSGCNGCQDAGAVSSQTIESGDGYVEFTVDEVASERAFGLNLVNTGTTINEIAFALLIWPGGGLNVRESGTYRMGLPVAVGDRLRVAVTAGQVTYAKNGVVFYTSKVAPSYPLMADTSILTRFGTITNAVIASFR